MRHSRRAGVARLLVQVALPFGAIAAGISARSLAQAPPARRAGSTVEVPAWAFPVPATTGPAVFDSLVPLHVPRSRAAFTSAQAHDRFAVIDWHPELHGTMPDVVAHGRRPAVIACGYCHLPDGSGRPENAMLAGLPEEYMLRQVADIRSRARRIAWPHAFGPSDGMRVVADSATDAEIAEAARYFSRQRPRQRSRVVEAREIPRASADVGLYVPAPGHATEPLGHRLIEMATEPSRHQLRDAAAPYVAYVPLGSIARGRHLATSTSRGNVARACTRCHGPDLRGVGVVPALAGQSPSYILRQLLGFNTGARSTAASAPMRDVAATLDLDDMIAAAAYAASRRP